MLKFLSFHFANSTRWREKQIYILTVDKLLERKAIEPKLFNLYVLKKLLEMANDKIPNIRICLARCLSTTLADNCKLTNFNGQIIFKLQKNYFSAFYLGDYVESKKRILQEITNFEKDMDRDVRDSVTSSDNKTDLLPPLSEDISGSNEALPPLPFPPPFQVDVAEHYDPPPPFEEHETIVQQQQQQNEFTTEDEVSEA